MEIREKLKEILKPEVESFGAELIDVEIRGKPGTYRLSVFADTESGISVDQCIRISRRLLRLSELEQVLGTRYRLEVSSPGVKRPLKTVEEFRRKIGLMVDILYQEGDRKKELRAKLTGVTSHEILLEAQESEMAIPLKNIIKAVQVLPW